MTSGVSGPGSKSYKFAIISTVAAAPTYNGGLELEKTLLRKVGEAVARFKMIRNGDRVAVALSGGKDSVTMLEALLLLKERAPIDFTVCAFTVEQGKFLRPIQPFGEYLKARGVDWTYHTDNPSIRLIDEQPDHGCDLCSRYRRRAVYQIVRGLGANVIAFGHTADDFCESFLRNALFTGRISALPPITYSRQRDFRLIRPLVYVTEDLTTRFAESLGAPVIPCGCSQRTGTVRRTLRDMFGELEKEHPHLKETLLSAMGNIQTGRLLDPRFLDLDGETETAEAEAASPFAIVD
jgi:tRNA 2-thiocytidine biosynthesis protein TtcA